MSAAERTDNTSLVPQFRFPETLAEQEAALQTNSLMQRLLAYRERYEGDPHRPIYHYVNPENTLNDPNGLCFWQDRWHLFYQAYPPEDPRQHWGHAVSDDLIHWQDLPYAIYPNPEECCFSGAALVEDERVIAIYHGTKVGNMVAVSHDPLLLNWEKLTGAPVIPIASEDGSPLPYRVFDPCIWKKGDHYYALSGGTLPHAASGRRTRANFLFRSPNLVDWDYLHPFVEDDRFTLVGDDGACPYFWPIGDRHILLFFSHMSGGQALLGDYDIERDKFVVTSQHDFNFGAYGPGGVHAPSAAPDGKGGVNVIFNMNPAKPTEGWNQIMTLPAAPDAAGNRQNRPRHAAGRTSWRCRIAARGAPPNHRYDPARQPGDRLGEHQGKRDRTDGRDRGERRAAIRIECAALPRQRGVYPHRLLSRARLPQLGAVQRLAARQTGRRHRQPHLHRLLSTPLSRPTSVHARPRPDRSSSKEMNRCASGSSSTEASSKCSSTASSAWPCVSTPTGKTALASPLRSQGQDARVVSLEAWQMENIYA